MRSCALVRSVFTMHRIRRHRAICAFYPPEDSNARRTSVHFQQRLYQPRRKVNPANSRFSPRVFTRAEHGLVRIVLLYVSVTSAAVKSDFFGFWVDKSSRFNKSLRNGENSDE